MFGVSLFLVDETMETFLFHRLICRVSLYKATNQRKNLDRAQEFGLLMTKERSRASGCLCTRSDAAGSSMRLPVTYFTSKVVVMNGERN